MRKSIKIFLGFLLVLSAADMNTYASSTDGTIDSVYKYAWSEKLGWINFGLSSGNVHVLDDRLTGYAWNENTGWIILNLSSSTYVANNSEGVLSGYAWGEGIGWIDFSGVTIDASGYFHGYASSTLGGQISFNCLNTSSCGQSDWKTKTDWLKASLRSTQSNQSTIITSFASGGSWFPNSYTPINNISTPTPLNKALTQIKTPTTTSECSAYLLKHIKYNKKNDTGEVKKLQSFLAKYEGFPKLNQDGIYNKSTMNAVHSFQNKYLSDIMGPWQTGKSTGYVYKTTLKKVNDLYCDYTK